MFFKKTLVAGEILSASELIKSSLCSHNSTFVQGSRELDGLPACIRVTGRLILD